MKKSALLILAAIFVIGIQSCSTDDQEEISPENLTVTKLGSGNNKIGTVECRKDVYVNFGTMSLTERNTFFRNAELEWYGTGNILVKPTDCPYLVMWNVPCLLLFSDVPTNIESDEDIMDAEGSMATTQDGGSTNPFQPKLKPTPTILAGSITDYSACISPNEEDNTDDPFLIGPPDDDDDQDLPGLPIRNIR